MLLLRAMLFSPAIAILITVAAVVFAKKTNRLKPKVISLVGLSVLSFFAVSMISLAWITNWMNSYEETSGYSAGNTPAIWLFFVFPMSAAVGQLLALVVWWFIKPTKTNGNGEA